MTHNSFCECGKQKRKGAVCCPDCWQKDFAKHGGRNYRCGDKRRVSEVVFHPTPSPFYFPCRWAGRVKP
jgi:hypothetical protein